MDKDLWNLYLELQTIYAYSEVDSSNIKGGNNQYKISLPYLTNRNYNPNVVLVIGPGSSNEVFAIKETFNPKITVVLTAHQPELSPYVQEDIITEVGDIHDMPFGTGGVDFIFNSNVMEHCFAPYIALMECRRVLKYRGYAYFIIPSFGGTEGGKGPFHLHCLTEQVWRELLVKTGFIVADFHEERGGVNPEASYYHFICQASQVPEPHRYILQNIISYKEDLYGKRNINS